MKELTEHKPEEIEMHAVKPVKKEVQYVGTLRKHPGQKVWQIDLSTNLITEAEYEKGVADFKKAEKGDTSARHKLIMNENCLYCTAISARVADKKFIKMIKKFYDNR